MMSPQTHSQHVVTRFVVITGIILVVLHIMFTGTVQLFGVSANLLFVFCGLVSFVYGRSAGTICGFTCGLLFDLLGAGTIGQHALLWCVAGYVMGTLYPTAFRDGLAKPLGMFLMVDAAAVVLDFVLNIAFGVELSVSWVPVLSILAQIALDFVFALVVFAIARHRLEPSIAKSKLL